MSIYPDWLEKYGQDAVIQEVEKLNFDVQTENLAFNVSNKGVLLKYSQNTDNIKCCVKTEKLLFNISNEEVSLPLLCEGVILCAESNS